MSASVQHQPLRVTYPSRDRLSDVVGRALGRSPLGAKQLLYGPHRANLVVAQLVPVIHDFSLSAFGHWAAPMLAAFRGIRAAALTPALELQARTADADEDVAFAAHVVAPSHATAAQELHQLDVEISLKLELRAALAAACGLA